MSAKINNMKSSFKRKAFGLIEVLIAIAISGVIMLGSVIVSTNALRLVKQNELRDSASGVLLRSLELARSPIDFSLRGIQGQARTGYYSLQINSDGKYQLTSSLIQDEISSCDANSSYRVVQRNPDTLICNQVIVSNITPSADAAVFTNFEIKSIVVYSYLGQQYSDELISYRKELGAV
jgi:prepilin-type N-terminal cleavage/methylation domain-containing protein